jgi:alpha-amylase/alpha-mannosidase (GH57 family)
MHQPNYQEPDSARMMMPWVRLHALKDYLDMPLEAARHEGIKVTFNLVPSLLDQIELYIQGGTDPHLHLSGIAAEELTRSQRMEILNSFFSCHPQTMIEPYPRYRELHRKVRDNLKQDILPSLFTSEEIRDLQVWSNLTWVDPMFRQEEPLKSLFAKGRHFTEEEKTTLLAWQHEFLKRIVPTYKKLFDEGRIDISFTPYYHPILPLLCDTNVALEAMPGVTLPRNRFVHPEDAERQVGLAAEKYEKLFGKKMKGMWPSEGSVSEEVARIMLKFGVEWIATDEEILYHSAKKAGKDPAAYPIHSVYQFGSGLKMFFRDHLLSDRIGFVYSGLSPDMAVTDFVSNLLSIRQHRIDQLDNTVIPVILDGENAWEYFPEDGREFLTKFYSALAKEPNIELVTMSELATNAPAKPLEQLFAGSWINHNFRIWIGHPEDNAAWDQLSRTRDKLVEFEKQHPNFDPVKLEKAWRQIYIAEGSDWCWWYGDEHRGEHNEQFDRIFRHHLIAVYEFLGLEIPVQLLNPITSGEASIKPIMPDDMVTPQIDGRLSHFYEWTGAGHFECADAGGAMHRVERYISRIWFAFDHDNLYIRLDFLNKKKIDLLTEPVCVVTLLAPQQKKVRLALNEKGTVTDSDIGMTYCCDEILEVAISRNALFKDGNGKVGITATLFDGENRLESCPEDEPISIDIPERDMEMFWPA